MTMQSGMIKSEDCLFCKIVRGEIPSKEVYDDKNTIAFLDINPATPGHVLVVPKKHAEDITKIDEDDLSNAIAVVKNISTLLMEKLNAIGVNVLQNNGKHAGQLVSHLHFHVIPRYPNDNVIITYQRAHLSEDDLEEIRKKLSEEKPAKKDFDFDF